jgi:hypothetical protein
MNTLLSLLVDGALAAAQLLALLFVPPASAAEPAEAAHPIALHRLSTALDVRLLGSLADVRVVQHLRNDGQHPVDLAAALPADHGADTVRVTHGTRTIQFGASGGACGDALYMERAQLTLDEAIADALTLAPGAEATIETITAQPMRRSGGAWRVALPKKIDADRARVLLVDQGDARFVVVVPHIAAQAATLLLRPARGAAEHFELGAVEPGSAIVVPLATRFDALVEGAIELTLIGEHQTVWSTIVGEVANAPASVQAQAGE